MPEKLSLIQVNNILRIRPISHCVDIIHVFLYLILRHFIFMNTIKTVTLFITCIHVVIHNVHTLGGGRGGPAKGVLALMWGGRGSVVSVNTL